MKRHILNLAFLTAAAFVLTAADVRVKRLDGGEGGGGGGGGGVRQGMGGDRGWRGNGNGRAGSQNRSVRTENVQPRSSQVTVGAGHTRIVRQSGSPTPIHHEAIANNTTIVHSIEHDRRVEIVPNHQYWHNSGGVRFVHTFRGGIHWYGFYHGSNFYWTRYYQNRWWWYDDGFDHWVFWWGGRWWWNGPNGQLYVYVNDSYYPYNEAPVAVTAPVPSGPAPEETENNGGAWTSQDGKRMVQIHGPQAEAFLYDNSGSQPSYLAYLGKNVERVRFSGGIDNRPLRILVDFKNGEFTLFSSEGEPIDLTPPDAPSGPPSEGPPTDVPPTPPATDVPKK